MNILLCDDHRLFVEALSVVFRARGYDVTWVTSPAAAVQAVRQGPVDLCLLDLHFPDGNGLSVIADILSVSPGTRVVVLSASADDRVLSEAMEAGASAVAAKGDDLERIIEVVRQVHSGDVVGSPAPSLGVPPLSAHPSTPPQHLGGFLTQRERQVLEHLVRGENAATVARSMGVQYSTVRTHIQNILAKLGVHSKLEAVALAVREGIVAVGSSPGGPVGNPGRP